MSKEKLWLEQLEKAQVEKSSEFLACLAIANQILELKSENFRGLRFAVISYLTVAITWWLNANLSNPELTTLPAFGAFFIAFVHSLFYFSINRPRRNLQISVKSNDLQTKLIRKSQIPGVSRLMLNIASFDRTWDETILNNPIRKRKPKRHHLALSHDGELPEDWDDEDNRQEVLRQ